VIFFVTALSAMHVLLYGIVVFLFAMFLLVLPFFRAWLAAALCGVKVRISELIAMRLRGVPYKCIVDATVIAVKNDLMISIEEIKEHWIVGGHPIQTVRALARLRSFGIGHVDWHQICAIDLAAKEMNDEIFGLSVAAVKSATIKIENLNVKTKDGKPFRVSIRIAYRLIIDRYLGNLRDINEVTSRISLAMIAAIGSVASPKSVMEHPDSICNEVLNLRLDADTAFEILSVKISHIDMLCGKVQAQKTLSPEEEMQVMPISADLRYVTAYQLATGIVKIPVAGEIREYDIDKSLRYKKIQEAFMIYSIDIIDVIIKDGPQKDNYWVRELFQVGDPTWEWDRSQGKMTFISSGIGSENLWDSMSEWNRTAFLKMLIRKRNQL
jgi:uncharacterized protein YqfA (UPF0365 family)